MKFAAPFHRPRRTLSGHLLSLALAGCLGAATGCGGADGPPTAHLEGTVTIAGQPLPADAVGQVIFSPTSKDQAKSVSAPITSGRYDAPNAPLGHVNVSFEIVQPSGPEYTTSRGEKAREMKSLVPPSFTGGVEVDVTDDNAEQNFDVK